MAEETADLPSTGDKIRYQIDRFLSWSPLARFIGLFCISFILGRLHRHTRFCYNICKSKWILFAGPPLIIDSCPGSSTNIKYR